MLEPKKNGKDWSIVYMEYRIVYAIGSEEKCNEKEGDFWWLDDNEKEYENSLCYDLKTAEKTRKGCLADFLESMESTGDTWLKVCIDARTYSGKDREDENFDYLEASVYHLENGHLREVCSW